MLESRLSLPYQVLAISPLLWGRELILLFVGALRIKCLVFVLSFFVLIYFLHMFFFVIKNVWWSDVSKCGRNFCFVEKSVKHLTRNVSSIVVFVTTLIMIGHVTWLDTNSKMYLSVPVIVSKHWACFVLTDYLVEMLLMIFIKLRFCYLAWIISNFLTKWKYPSNTVLYWTSTVIHETLYIEYMRVWTIFWCFLNNSFILYQQSKYLLKRYAIYS